MALLANICQRDWEDFNSGLFDRAESTRAERFSTGLISSAPTVLRDRGEEGEYGKILLHGSLVCRLLTEGVYQVSCQVVNTSISKDYKPLRERWTCSGVEYATNKKWDILYCLSSSLRRHDPIFLHPVDQCMSRYTQETGRCSLVPLVALQCLHDYFPLQLFQGITFIRQIDDAARA